MEPPPARELKPGHTNSNVQKNYMEFYTIEMEFHIHIANTIMKFALILRITFF